MWQSLSTQSCGGLTALKPVRLKCRHNHLPVEVGGLGNTVQQQMEWKEEAKVISSQSNARKEETRAMEVSTVLRGLPTEESWLQPAPRLLKGCCFWGKEWEKNSKSLHQCIHNVHIRALKSVWPVHGWKKTTFTALLMP